MEMPAIPGPVPGRTCASLRLPAFAPPAAEPIVVAVEGPNGAGKTTLSWALAQELGVCRCLGTDEAWAADHLKVRMIRDADWFASAMFFLSGCFEQMRSLKQRPSRLVIMDRCLWSTLAVHAAADPDRLLSLIDMLRPIASHIQIPHLTLVLDASFETCQTRIAKKTGTARVLDELTANPDFHTKEARFYRWLAGESPNVVFVDANHAGASQVAKQAMDVIRTHLPGL